MDGRAEDGPVTARPSASHEACCARIGRAMPTFATRKGERCASRAAGFHELTIRGEVVALPVCKIHEKMLHASSDPAALARSWRS